MELKLDKDKILKVSIDKVVPNTWNPKEEDTKEFQDILQSVKTNGLRDFIVVREHPTTKGYYEIIDGQQRYTAAKKLSYTEIYIYNEGRVEDKKAQELTIWYQQQVPFHRISEAYLVTQMVTDYGLDTLNLPYSEVQIEEFKEIADFNFDLYKPDEFKENQDGTITFSVKMQKDQHDIVKESLDRYCGDNKCSMAEALVDILQNV